MSVTFAGLVVKNLEYVEETTYRTFPANPTMLFLAQSAKWTPSEEMMNNLFRRLGSEDAFKNIQGKQVYKSTLEFDVANSTLLKYGINAQGGGAGSIDKSLSIGMSVKIAGTENFIKLPGSRINTLKLNTNPDQPSIKCSAEIHSSDITTPSVTDYIGAGAHATADATAPWSFADGGVDNITWNAVALPIIDFNVNFNRNLANKFVVGDQKIKYQLPTVREINGDFTIEWLNTTQETDMKANTARTLAWVLKTATSTLTLTNAYLKSLAREKDADSKDTIMEKFAFDALSASIT